LLLLLLRCALRAAVAPDMAFIPAGDPGCGDLRCCNANAKILTPHLDRKAQTARLAQGCPSLVRDCRARRRANHAAMSPADQEAALRDDFSIISDPHERLSAIVASCAGPGMNAGEQTERNLVSGCVSSVWLTGTVENGTLVLRWDAASPLVRGLAGLICKVYHGASSSAAAAWETGILESLGLTRQISPTRLNGLVNVARRVRELAASLT